MKIKIQVLLTLLLFLSNFLFAHPGGHGSHTHHSPYDVNNVRTWHFQDESIAAKGNFMLSKEGKVWIETDNSIKCVAIQRLSAVDQQFLQGKLKHIAAINHPRSLHKSAVPFIATWNYKGLLLALCYGLLSITLAVSSFRLFRNSNQRFHKNPIAIGLILSSMFFGVACSTTDTVNDNPIVSSDATVMAQAFAPYSRVTTTTSGEYFLVESNGIPDHTMMTGITAWIDQVPTPHDYTGTNAWKIPLQTQYANEVLTIEDHFHKGAIAIAANGIPIFNPYNASNEISAQIGELDQYGGHSGRGDDYHYHTAPLHLETTSGNFPIGYALDGYPIYGSKEPDGSAMNPLDSYHGHEHSDGTYHYHGTTTFPYMIAAMRGVVTMSGTAPEDQITPQPVGQAFRTPRGLTSKQDNTVITSCDSMGTNGYILRYTLNGLPADVTYSWDNAGFYTFIFHDANGTTATETHQK